MWGAVTASERGPTLRALSVIEPPLDVQPPFEEAHYVDGFAHADGKFHFKADWSAPPWSVTSILDVLAGFGIVEDEKLSVLSPVPWVGPECCYAASVPRAAVD